MMTIEHLTACAMFAMVTSITPGPNNAMLMTSGMNFGFARSLPHMMGINLGFPVMLIAVGLGFGALFVSYPILHLILEVIGSAYLLWLAWKIASSSDEVTTMDERKSQPLTIWQAAAFQWVNPKAWVIAIGAVAIYLRPASFVSDLIMLALVFAVVNLPCIALWAASGAAMRRLVSSPRQRKIFNIAMALMLVASVLLPAIVQW